MTVRTRRERYGAAASNGQLRVRDDRMTDADTIAAAGMAGAREPRSLHGRGMLPMAACMCSATRSSTT